MNFQVAFFVALVLLVAAIVYVIVVKKERDKYLLTYEPVKHERDLLKESNESLTKQLAAAKSENISMKANHKASKKSAKNAAKLAAKDAEAGKSPELAALESKLSEIKDNVSKLKDENFRLKSENKDLRKQAREHENSGDEEAKTIVLLRDERDDAKKALEKAEQRIAELEKQSAEAAKEQPVVKVVSPDDVVVKAAEDAKAAEELDRLKRDNANLSAKLNDVRNEFAEFKKGYRDQLDASKKEIAAQIDPVKEENAVVKRQLQQSKVRADNNHKIFLIARAQLMLVEKRLAQFDASYKPLMLGTSNNAIDDTIKKYLTHDIRETRASADVVTRDREISALKAEVESLKSQLDLSKLKTSASSTDAKLDTSISSLVDSLANELSDDGTSELFGGSFDLVLDPKTAAQKLEEKPKASGLAGLTGIDFGSDDSWDF